MKELLSYTKKSVACMKDAGFELRKFHTNDANLQTTINKIEEFQPLEDNLTVLGIDWHKQSDSFINDLNKIYEAGIELPTIKRNVLKFMVSIYDPIGIVSPVVVFFKILFQKICLLKCEWDNELNPELASESKKSLNSLKEMIFTVPICYFSYFNSITVFDLHAFSDASKRVPLFVYPMLNRVYALIQPVSIPRLELLSCLLFAESVETVLDSLRASLTIRNIIRNIICSETRT